MAVNVDVYRAKGAVEDQCDENHTQTCHDSGNSECQNSFRTLETMWPTLPGLHHRFSEALDPVYEAWSENSK